MYLFKKTLNIDNEFDMSNVSIELPYNDLSITDIFDYFVSFLSACGFQNCKQVILEYLEEDYATQKRDQQEDN